LAFLETSALDATNVDEAFNSVIKEAYASMGRRTLDNKSNPNVKGGVTLGPSQAIPNKQKQPQKQQQHQNPSCCN
jgi:hypothetical protein